MLPSLFVAHGAPLLAIEDNEYTQFLQSLGKSLPKPNAIVLFSAHWESPVQMLSEASDYSTIYDFGGFPEALYRIVYPAKGHLETAKDMEELFENAGVTYQVDTNRGLDHGAWVVLKKMYPDADIPVLSMSVNPNLTPEEQYKIGQSLQSLREKDVLVIASGGTVHNLRAVKMMSSNESVDQWALDFDNWLAEHIEKWDTDSLFQYDKLAPAAEIAVPPYGNEHFIPIFYAMGAADQSKKASLLHRSYRYGNLSHSVWQFG
ncbi:dioxygenase [Bacillus sp. BGMRC 2118]|nr:dioxygenase [Bacillus sp. BGMRC 2118]